MAVTAPYWHCNLVPFTNLAFSSKKICSLCTGRDNKNMCLGTKDNRYLYRVPLSCNGRKMILMANASGFGESDTVDNDGGDDDNASFWDKNENKEKIKDMEDMRELIEEAEKLQTSDAAGSKEESEEERKIRVREELAKRAREQAEQRKMAEIMFQMGQRAYGKGMYNKAVELLEGALTNVSGVTLFGGEIQLWLAMAYDAQNRHSDCIALYKTLEKTHPMVPIRRQAAGLRYILEAPKLKISKDEMVSIPLIDSNYDRSKRSWSQTNRNRRMKSTINKESPTMRDYFADFLVWKPPRWERSPYFWVAVAVWLTLIGVALVFQD